MNTVSEQLHTRGPFLIIAPLSTIPHWYREFTGWTNLNTIVYHGSASDRERAREDEFPFPEDKVSEIAFNQRYLQKVAKKWRSKWEKTWMVEVVITTPEMLVTEDFSELAAVKWEILVVDEAHRLKNHNSKLAQNLRDSRFEFQHSLLLTGVRLFGFQFLDCYNENVMYSSLTSFSPTLVLTDTNPKQYARTVDTP